MASRKKWEIAHLGTVRRFRSAAGIITSHRLRNVIDLAHAFKASHDVEDLHQLRIALRRLRYPLETLLSQFRRRSVLRFIDELNLLQDAAGAARDLDVLIARLARSNDEQHWQLRRIVFLDLQAERLAAYQAAEDAINMFLVSPLLYDFKTGIDFDTHDPAQRDPYPDDGDGEYDDAPDGDVTESLPTISDPTSDHGAPAPRVDGQSDGGTHAEGHFPDTHSDRLF